MANSVTVHVTGLRELGEAMRKLSTEVNLKIASAATGAAARVIRDQAKRLAPIAPEDYDVQIEDSKQYMRVKAGNVRDNIVAKKVPKSQTMLTSEHVVAIRGKRKYGYASRIGSLNEWGTVNMPAQPFMRPAWDQEKGFAAQKMEEKLRDGIAKAVLLK